MSKQILKDMETKAEKTLHALREELKTVRAGRANPSVLDNIMVDYYGTSTPLKQVARFLLQKLDYLQFSHGINQ